MHEGHRKSYRIINLSQSLLCHFKDCLMFLVKFAGAGPGLGDSLIRATTDLRTTALPVPVVPVQGHTPKDKQYKERSSSVILGENGKPVTTSKSIE